MNEIYNYTYTGSKDLCSKDDITVLNAEIKNTNVPF